MTKPRVPATPRAATTTRSRSRSTVPEMEEAEDVVVETGRVEDVVVETEPDATDEEVPGEEYGDDEVDPDGPDPDGPDPDGPDPDPDGPDPDPDPDLHDILTAILGLAQEVSDLRREVTGLQGTQADSFDHVHRGLVLVQEAVEPLHHVPGQVEDLRTRIGEVADATAGTQVAVEQIGPKLANDLGYISAIVDGVAVRGDAWKHDVADYVFDRIRPGPIVIPPAVPVPAADPGPLENARHEVEVLLDWAQAHGHQAVSGQLQDYRDGLALATPAQFDLVDHRSRLDDLREELQRAAQRREGSGR